MRSMLFVALAAGLAFTASQAGAQHHDHHQATAPAPALRYATDAPLREHMDGIRIAVAALEHGEHGHLDAVQVVALADVIQAHVRGIVAECKLAPEADAVLHGIIAPLRAALDAYDTNFDEAPAAE